MKGVILTPNIAKFFHPAADIEGKKCLTPNIQKNMFLYPNTRHSSNYTKSTLDTVFFQSTPETVKYFILTLDTYPFSRVLVLLSKGKGLKKQKFECKGPGILLVMFQSPIQLKNNLFKKYATLLPVTVLTELQVRISRGCQFLLFLPHKFQVSLRDN